MKLPSDPETTIGYEPGGVPLVGPPPPPPPPLHPTTVINHATSSRQANEVQRRLRGPAPSTKMPASVSPPPAAQALRTVPRGNRLECDATVLTVSVVLPLPVTEGGLKLQVAVAGSPWHAFAAKVTVPLYPGWPVTESVRLPLPPGAEIVITEPVLPLKAMEKSRATLTVIALEVEPV